MALGLVIRLGFAIVGFFTILMIWIILFPNLLTCGSKRLFPLQKYVTFFAVSTLSVFGIWFVIWHLFT